MIFKTWVDTSSVALGASDFEVRVFVTLDIDSADDYAYSLRKYDLTPVAECDLCDTAKGDLAEFVSASREDYAQYERDMRAQDREYERYCDNRDLRLIEERGGCA